MHRRLCVCVCAGMYNGAGRWKRLRASKVMARRAWVQVLSTWSLPSSSVISVLARINLVGAGLSPPAPILSILLAPGILFSLIILQILTLVLPTLRPFPPPTGFAPHTVYLALHEAKNDEVSACSGCGSAEAKEGVAPAHVRRPPDHKRKIQGEGLLPPDNVCFVHSLSCSGQGARDPHGRRQQVLACRDFSRHCCRTNVRQCRGRRSRGGEQ